MHAFVAALTLFKAKKDSFIMNEETDDEKQGQLIEDAIDA